MIVPEKLYEKQKTIVRTEPLIQIAGRDDFATAAPAVTNFGRGRGR